jgi:protein O-GlcNAc transferase
VQLSYLGYPHSTGLPCIDWMIADAVVAPPEHAHLFTEQVARVSGSVFCWAPVDEYPLPPDPVAVPNRPVVFGSFNNLLKVDDATIDVWARILRECPKAQLLLKSAVLADPVVQQQTQARFVQAGVGAERLILRGPTELSLMMQEYLEVDVALDPFPYNGGTTSLQALWMGCPLVSLQGQNFVSRMGASFLTHLQRTEWLAHDTEGYVAQALALAQQLRQQPWSRQALRRQMQASGLCQIERHTREMEAIYRQALEGAAS